jgi:hypothetical protein
MPPITDIRSWVFGGVLFFVVGVIAYYISKE